MKLSEVEKGFIVDHNAIYYTPQQVADAFKVEFDKPLTRQQVEEYDPAKRCKTPKWCARHAAVRAKFLDDVAIVPEANMAVRVAALARMARIAERSRNMTEARAALRQIAEEVGGLLTNTRLVGAADPLKALAKLLGMTTEQIKAVLELDDLTGGSGATDGSEGSDGSGTATS